MPRIRRLGANDNGGAAVLRLGERLRIAPDRPGCARRWRATRYPHAALRVVGSAGGGIIEFDAVGLGSGTVRLTAAAAGTQCGDAPTAYSVRVRVLRNQTRGEPQS